MEIVLEFVFLKITEFLSNSLFTVIKSWNQQIYESFR